MKWKEKKRNVKKRKACEAALNFLITANFSTNYKKRESKKEF